MKKILIMLFAVLLLSAACNGKQASLQNNQPIPQTTPSPSPTADPIQKPGECADSETGSPVITSLSKTSGSVGTAIEIYGCNFSGFEGDKNAWIENSEGVRGILYGQEGSTSKLIKVVLKSPLCQTNTSYSDLPCEKWLTLKKGNYKIFVSPWAEDSNKIDFVVK